MASLTKDFVRPKIPKPTELEVSETNRLFIAIWEKKVSPYCTRTDYFDSNLKTAYAVIWGQCSEAMKAKLTSLDDFETQSHESDCVWILKEKQGYPQACQPSLFWLPLGRSREPVLPRQQPVSDQFDRSIQSVGQLQASHTGQATSESAQSGACSQRRRRHYFCASWRSDCRR